MNMIQSFLLLAFLLSTTTLYVSAIDFCIGDVKSAPNPAGYPCKSPSKVTVDDFVFSNFVEGKPNIFNFSFTPAFVDQFPAFNGLGLSASRFDIEVGGIVPLHAHADATEVIIMTQGKLTAGFITSDTNTVYKKTLSAGNIMVLPQGLLHFAINAGSEKATATVVFSGERPSVQLLDLALFGNNFDSALVAKTTFLDPAQIKKLKGVFKGTN